ncbi:MAG: hypothetical protein ACREYE_11815 [Gammaproteobacteria bacterium]
MTFATAIWNTASSSITPCQRETAYPNSGLVQANKHWGIATGSMVSGTASRKSALMNLFAWSMALERTSQLMGHYRPEEVLTYLPL